VSWVRAAAAHGDAALEVATLSILEPHGYDTARTSLSALSDTGRDDLFSDKLAAIASVTCKRDRRRAASDSLRRAAAFEPAPHVDDLLYLNGFRM